MGTARAGAAGNEPPRDSAVSIHLDSAACSRAEQAGLCPCTVMARASQEPRGELWGSLQ